MKKIKILPLIIIAGFAILLTSCTVSRSYGPYPAAPDASLSLIVNPYPGIVVSRYYDGRYYYRNPQGYTYWRGYDNRYYLDRSYVGKRYYHHRDYDDWHNNGRRGRRW
jgi:hypothetical protein